jgi:malate permease and related proteins
VNIADTLAPIILLIVLGGALAHVRFLGQTFMADLNKLVFWIALPALLFRSASHAAGAGAQTGTLVGVLCAGTLLVALVGWAVSLLLGVPANGRGTFVQAVFRANLAFIGVPAMAQLLQTSAPGPNLDLTTAVVAMAFTMAFYNALAVIVLQASRSTGASRNSWALLTSVATNPLLLSGMTGMAVAFSGLVLPTFVDRTLEVLGDASVPIALMCIGGSLRFAKIEGRVTWITAAALLKVGGSPAIVWGLSRAVGLGPLEHRVAVVFAACPTAAASYIMARQMDGDATLASGSVALSTMLSLASMTLVLWLTS